MLRQQPGRHHQPGRASGLFYGNNPPVNIQRWLSVTLLACWVTLASAQGPQQPLLPEVPLFSAGERLPLAGQAQAWVDDSSTLTAQALSGRAGALGWERFDPARSYLLEGKALWLRFDAQVPSDSRWFIALTHPSVDRIELHHLRPDGRWQVQSAGQKRSVEDWSVPGRVPTFELAPATDGKVRYWLRITRERGSFSAPLHFYSQSALLEARASEQFVLGAYFGVLAFLAAASLVGAILYRDRNFIGLLAYLAGICAVQFVYLGLGAQHLWTNWPHWTAAAQLVVPGTAVAACLWFIQLIAEPARFSRLLHLAASGLIAALLAGAAMNGLIDTRGSFLLSTLLIGASLPLSAALLWMAWRVGRDPFMGIVSLGFVPVVLGAMLPIAYVLGLLPESVLTRHGLTIGTALQLPLTYYALSRRAHGRSEPGRRAAQLTHADALTGLWNRDTLLRRMEESLRRAIGQEHQCAVLAVRLTNHDTLEHELGRANAERALVVAASILRGAASDTDLVARIGDHDFALLLEGPTSGPAAVARAQQIVARGLQHAPALPPATTLKFHVAVTLLPEQDLDAPRCLRWLEDACNAMRTEPRRAIRSLNF